MEENYKEIETKKYKKLIEIVTAYLQGKQIQYKLIDDWANIDDIKYIDFINIDLYRIKPAYRPCKNAEEFTKLIHDHRSNITIKNKITRTYEYIVGYNDYEVQLSFNKHKSYEKLFEDYCFVTNSNNNVVIGILEEETLEE